MGWVFLRDQMKDAGEMIGSLALGSGIEKCTFDFQASRLRIKVMGVKSHLTGRNTAKQPSVVAGENPALQTIMIPF